MAGTNTMPTTPTLLQACEFFVSVSDPHALILCRRDNHIKRRARDVLIIMRLCKRYKKCYDYQMNDARDKNRTLFHNKFYIVHPRQWSLCTLSEHEWYRVSIFLKAMKRLFLFLNQFDLCHYVFITKKESSSCILIKWCTYSAAVMTDCSISSSPGFTVTGASVVLNRVLSLSCCPSSVRLRFFLATITI